MADFSLEWNADFQPDATGDILIVDGDDSVRQRLQRRLYTARQGYVWHPSYGAGLPQDIGDPMTASQVESICQQQLVLEASVAPSPPAQLTVASQPGGLFIISILYWDAATGQAVSFQITN